jgi:glutaredoxin 3
MITIYSKPNCAYCDRAADYLQKNNIAFKKVDVTEDEKAMNFVKERGHRSLPQIYCGDRLLVEGGYDGLKGLQPSDLTLRMQQYANGKGQFQL